MTDEEKEAWRVKKREAVAWLSSNVSGLLDVYGVDMDAADSRIGDYVRSVCADYGAHNLYELLGIMAFFRKMRLYCWRADRVRRFVRFYELLKFNGTSGRTRYRLTPVQAFQFANIYGFAMEDGRRLTRTAYIFVPRKFSKTTSSASMAVYDMLFGDSNAQAYVGANSYQQAKVCFDEIRAIMRDLDKGEKHFRVNRELINFKSGQRDSFIRCLASNAKTQDGLFASLVILDEYSQARNTSTKGGDELKNVLTTSMGPRKNPLTVIITTASDVLDGPFVEELDGVKAVLRGEREDDTIFASLFMPDADDEEGDPRTWAKVQPHIGVTVQPDFYEREWRTAQLSAGNMLAFRTKLLNVFCVNETKTWVSTDKAHSLLDSSFDIDSVIGRPQVCVAFDLSVHDDFSAVSYTFYDRPGRCFYSHTDYYFPRGALSGHANCELYRAWADAGFLKLCDGDRIDVKQIGNDILRRARKLNIVRICYDSYKSQDLVNMLASVNADVLEPYAQTYGAFNLPVESFEMMIYDSPPRLHLNDNPINAYCLTNCVIDMDRLENKKPIKVSHTRKIDGAITMLMTIGKLYKIYD